LGFDQELWKGVRKARLGPDTAVHIRAKPLRGGAWERWRLVPERR
jgi:hypothetical protein